MPSNVKKSPGVKAKKVKMTKRKSTSSKVMSDSKEDFMQASNLTQMAASITALLEVIGQLKTHQKKKYLFKDEPKEIMLQVVPIKIPIMKTKQIRVVLPHSLTIDTCDVCLITEDVKKATKDNHDPSIDHFKNYLQDQRIKGVTQVVPIRQLRAEYASFEMKGRFTDMYDKILVDNRLYGIVTKFLGSRLFKRNKDLIPVKLNTTKFKRRVERALKLTVLTVHGKGDSFSVKVGFSHFSIEQLQENICAVAAALADHFPGGFNNVRKLLIKSGRSMALPVYISLKSSNSVAVPVVEENFPKAYEPVEGELTTIPGGFVKVLPTGEVSLRRKYVKQDVELGFARSTRQHVGREYENYNDVEDDFDDAVEEDEEEVEEDDNDKEEKVKQKRKRTKGKTDDDESSDDDVGAVEDAYLDDLECEMKQQNKEKAYNKNTPKLKQIKGNKKTKKFEEVEKSEEMLSKKQPKSKSVIELVSEPAPPKRKKAKLSRDSEEEETLVKQTKQPKRQKDKGSKEFVAELTEPKKKKKHSRNGVDGAFQNDSLMAGLNDKANIKLAKKLKKKKLKNKDKTDNNSLSSDIPKFSMRLSQNNSSNNDEVTKKKKKKARPSVLSRDGETSHNSEISLQKPIKQGGKFERYFSPKNKKTVG